MSFRFVIFSTWLGFSMTTKSSIEKLKKTIKIREIANFSRIFDFFQRFFLSRKSWWISIVCKRAQNSRLKIDRAGAPRTWKSEKMRKWPKTKMFRRRISHSCHTSTPDFLYIGLKVIRWASVLWYFQLGPGLVWPRNRALKN